MDTRARREGTKKKIIAIAAGCAVLGLGVTATLAAWTDTEWVFGGNGTGGPGIGTSSFEVEQSTDGGTTWVNAETNPGGQMVFAPDALALTPGDVVYAGVILRTALGSDAGTVELQPAVPAANVTVNDDDDLLYDALQVAFRTSATGFDCDASAFAGGSPATDIGYGALRTTGGTAQQPLAANAGSEQFYCFRITLPNPLPLAVGTDAEDYMGLTFAPAWEFQAISN